MSKKQLSATELVNTDVQFVSLVKRGANRIPFRITKEDDNMIDLHKIGRNLFKIADPKPAIVGALIKSGADVSKVEAILKESGVTAQLNKSEKDGLVTLAKADSEPADATSVVKVSDEVALVVTGLKKAFQNYDFSSWSFGEVMATEGYFAGLCTALDVLRSTVANIMMEATSPSEAAAAVGKACDDFKGYMITLTGGLPVDAFKADAILSKADLKPVAEPAAKSDEGAASAGADEGAVAKAAAKDPKDGDGDTEPDADDKDKAKKAQSADDDNDADMEPDGDEDDKKSKKKKGGDEATASEPNDVAKASNDQELDDKESGAGAKDTGPDVPKVKDDSAVLAAIEALKSSFEGAIDDVRKSVSEISGRVEEVSTFARKTDAALKGTVFNDESGDRDAKLKKSEAQTVVPLIDTAYSRRHA